MPYNHLAIEKKWIQNWSDSNLYKTPEIQLGNKKKYILEAFPYPSGDGLHVGHALPMTAGDITSRYYRMKGYSVLHPMGWDSFGLPTENFAKKKGLHPQEVTNNAIANFTKQIHRLGVDYDWKKELTTSSPEYYKWTQWFFQLLYKRGLAYKKEALVNWDPVDMTVLANEQVLADGTAERSGAKVEQKMMSQWFFKITDYAERLLTGLENLDWPESTKLMQKNWIGKSVGAEVDFEILQDEGKVTSLTKGVKVEDFGGITHIPYNKDLLDNSRDLRAEMTKYEELVWRNILKNEKIGYKFNRQKPLLNYIVDFYCSELQLIIEIDGESHNSQIGYDQKRTEELSKYGLKVLRFTNQEVNTNLNGVKIAIEEFIKDRINTIPPKSEILTPFVKGMTSLKIKIFTTRVDTIFGVTYLVLAPEHYLVDDLTTPEQFEAVEQYKEKSKQKSQFERTEMNKDKSGVFTGSYCINPFNGDKVPVWIGDYVLASYGTGAVMAVPAHDERDYEFAKKYDLEIKTVIAKNFGEDIGEAKNNSKSYAVLFDKKTQKYGIIQWNNFGKSLSLPGGTSDNNETELETLEREILEETGFYNFESVIKIPFISNCKYYSFAKKTPTNTFISSYSAVVDTNLSKDKKLEDYEQGQEVVWLESVEILTRLNASIFPDSFNKSNIEIFRRGVDILINQGFDKTSDKALFNLPSKIFIEYGILTNSGEFDGLTTKEAKIQMAKFAQAQGFGNAKVTYRLRDWSIGRQRYWGCPIPVIYDQNGNESLVPESDFPVILPQDLDLSTGMIKPLRSNVGFINSASQYGEGFTREGDTMDTFVCSSWYFFRYCSGNIDNAFANPEDMKVWMPVDQYIIGAEHSTMHLLYARFFTKVLFDAGYIDFDEPFTKMRHQGLILGPDNQKMSKSKGNVINPNEIFDEYGADTLRMYEMFMGPFDQSKPWSTSSIKGVRRFLDRVWNLRDAVYYEEDEATIHRYNGMKVESALHKLVKKIGEDIESYGFNTCVSEFMKFLNLVEDIGHIHIVQLEWFLTVLAPFAPFITEEIWQILGKKQSIHLQQFPKHDDNMTIEAEVTIGVQINGKVRGEITLSPTESQENTQSKVMQLEIVQKYLEGKQVKKFVYVAGKIVNLVIT